MTLDHERRTIRSNVLSDGNIAIIIENTNTQEELCHIVLTPQLAEMFATGLTFQIYEQKRSLTPTQLAALN